MRSLYVRIYLTVLAALALFAVVSSLFMERHMAREREGMMAAMQERAKAWAELLQPALPAADAPVEQQAAALADWSMRLRLPLALDDASGRRIAASEAYLRREAEAPQPTRRGQQVRLVDGRALWIMRPQLPREGRGPAPAPPMPGFAAPPWPWGLGTAAQSLLIFAAIALGAWPVVRRLTRRLEALKQGVEAFGAGELQRRVAEDGGDEVAALGASFNRTAARIETLLQSHRSLLANASHELRSPLARLKMAVAMIDEAPPARREGLRAEIHANIDELDALVEEVLLASRLESGAPLPRHDRVDLLALAAEEAARVQAPVDGLPLQVAGDERLLRRALRNLLENAQRYGGGQIEVSVLRDAAGRAEVRVCDRGPGVPEAFRERIFEAFFRLPGHAEREGGVGLGLALVRQIALAHGGSVLCQPRPGGGSCFHLLLPAA
jgi:signal transduction histidine kinase